MSKRKLRSKSKKASNDSDFKILESVTLEHNVNSEIWSDGAEDPIGIQNEEPQEANSMVLCDETDPLGDAYELTDEIHLKMEDADPLDTSFDTTNIKEEEKITLDIPVTKKQKLNVPNSPQSSPNSRKISSAGYKEIFTLENFQNSMNKSSLDLQNQVGESENFINNLKKAENQNCSLPQNLNLRHQSMCTSTQIYDNYNSDIRNNLDLLENGALQNSNLSSTLVGSYQHIQSPNLHNVDKSVSLQSRKEPASKEGPEIANPNPNLGRSLSDIQALLPNLGLLQSLMTQISSQTTSAGAQVENPAMSTSFLSSLLTDVPNLAQSSPLLDQIPDNPLNQIQTRTKLDLLEVRKNILNRFQKNLGEMRLQNTNSEHHTAQNNSNFGGTRLQNPDLGAHFSTLGGPTSQNSELEDPGPRNSQLGDPLPQNSILTLPNCRSTSLGGPIEENANASISIGPHNLNLGRHNTPKHLNLFSDVNTRPESPNFDLKTTDNSLLVPQIDQNSPFGDQQDQNPTLGSQLYQAAPLLAQINKNFSLLRSQKDQNPSVAALKNQNSPLETSIFCQNGSPRHKRGSQNTISLGTQNQPSVTSTEAPIPSIEALIHPRGFQNTIGASNMPNEDLTYVISRFPTGRPDFNLGPSEDDQDILPEPNFGAIVPENQNLEAPKGRPKVSRRKATSKKEKTTNKKTKTPKTKAKTRKRKTKTSNTGVRTSNFGADTSNLIDNASDFDNDAPILEKNHKKAKTPKTKAKTPKTKAKTPKTKSKGKTSNFEGNASYLELDASNLVGGASDLENDASILEDSSSNASSKDLTFMGQNGALSLPQGEVSSNLGVFEEKKVDLSVLMGSSSGGDGCQSGITDENWNPSLNLFRCYACKVQFPKRCELILHKMKHLLQNKMKKPFCLFCNLKFEERSEYREHLKRHNVGKVYFCRICQQQVKGGRAKLVQHKTYDCAEKNYQCAQCHERYFTMNDLQIHIDLRHLEKNLFCQTCNAVFQNDNDYFRHHHITDIFCSKCDRNFPESLLACKNGNKNIFKCYDCGETFTKQNFFIEHCNKTHWIYSMPSIPSTKNGEFEFVALGT